MSLEFQPGTFSSPATPASKLRMLAAQTRMEMWLFLRNGEQLLLALFIPAALLIGFRYFGLSKVGEGNFEHVVATIFALAVMSTSFTGLAIAVAFDRRYGALKMLGGTALPSSILIGGKAAATALLVIGQAVVLGALAVMMGWEFSLAGVLAIIPVLILGAACFASLGLLLGGTLKAELVLALANLIWFLLLGAAVAAISTDSLPSFLPTILQWTPSYALTALLVNTLELSVDAFSVCVLVGWTVAGSVLARRYFSFI